MIQENIKQANLHIVKLKRGQGWRSMCVMLDTVRAAHTLINSFDHSVSHLGHCGNIAEGETERLLDVFTSRGEWLHHSTGDEVQASLPANMVRDLTMMSLAGPLKKQDGRMGLTRRRQSVKFTPQKGAGVKLGDIEKMDLDDLTAPLETPQPLPESATKPPGAGGGTTGTGAGAGKAKVSFGNPPGGPRSPTPPASPPKGKPDVPNGSPSAASPLSSPALAATAPSRESSWTASMLGGGRKEASPNQDITYSPATAPEYSPAAQDYSA